MSVNPFVSEFDWLNYAKEQMRMCVEFKKELAEFRQALDEIDYCVSEDKNTTVTRAQEGKTTITVAVDSTTGEVLKS